MKHFTCLSKSLNQGFIVTMIAFFLILSGDVFCQVSKGDKAFVSKPVTMGSKTDETYGGQHYTFPNQRNIDSFKINDQEGNKKVRTVVYAKTLQSDPSNSGPFCVGGKLTLFANTSGGEPPYTFKWSGPNAFTSTSQDTTLSNVSFLDAGMYTVTVTDNAETPVSVTDTTIVIKDNIPPTIICPNNISVNNTIGCSKNVTTLNPVFSDNCSVSSVTWTISGATVDTSGAGGIRFVGSKPFNNGVSTVEYTVKDNSFRTNACIFTISVIDIAKPNFVTSNTDIVTSVVSGCSKNIAIPNVGYNDNCKVPLLRWAMSGATINTGNGQMGTALFNVGKTKVAYTLTDAQGNYRTLFFTVLVKDQIVPSITCPSNIVANAVGNSCSKYIATAAPVFEDNCSIKTLTWQMNGATVLSSPLTDIRFVSTKNFNSGLTTVIYTLKDPSGNTSSCSFNVQLNVSASCPSIIAAKGALENEENAAGLKVILSPNPTTTSFKLRLVSANKDPVEVVVYNNEGNKIQQLKTNYLQNVEFGSHYVSGTYLLDVRQGENRTTIVGVKQ